MTNSTFLGPLPTDFTLPDACLRQTGSIGSDVVRFKLADVPWCYPSGYADGFSSSAYYSANNCPPLYNTGCLSINTSFGIEVLCCLGKLTCDITRAPPFTAGPDNVMQYGMCGSTFDGTSPYTVPGDPNIFNITRILAYGIRIRPQYGNTRATTTVTETAAPGATITADLAQTTGSTPTNDAVAAPESAGLATGAKVGLGVGLVVVLCVLGAVWMLVRRRRRRRAISAGAELDAENTAMARRQELDVGACPTYHELDSCQGPRAELEVEPVVRTELRGDDKS